MFQRLFESKITKLLRLFNESRSISFFKYINKVKARSFETEFNCNFVEINVGLRVRDQVAKAFLIDIVTKHSLENLLTGGNNTGLVRVSPVVLQNGVRLDNEGAGLMKLAMMTTSPKANLENDTLFISIGSSFIINNVKEDIRHNDYYLTVAVDKSIDIKEFISLAKEALRINPSNMSLFNSTPIWVELIPCTAEPSKESIVFNYGEIVVPHHLTYQVSLIHDTWFVVADIRPLYFEHVKGFFPYSYYLDVSDAAIRLIEDEGAKKISVINLHYLYSVSGVDIPIRKEHQNRDTWTWWINEVLVRYLKNSNIFTDESTQRIVIEDKDIVAYSLIAKQEN